MTVKETGVSRETGCDNYFGSVFISWPGRGEV